MKVNIGRQAGKKYRHILPSTTETTSQFGFYQPNYFRECVAQDTVNIRSAAAVRLMPVVKPTFGRLFLKQYCNFVPMEDIWHPWASFLAGKPYNGAYAQYIPQESPTIELGFWNLMCMCMSDICCYNLDVMPDPGVNGTYNLTGVDFSSSVPFSVQLFQGIIDELVGSCTSFSNTDFSSFLYTFLNSNGYINYKDLNPKDLDLFDWFIPAEVAMATADLTVLICGRFSDAGKNLRKIVIGLGGQLNFDRTPFDFMRFVAYYKTWFDMFAVQRDITWKQTRAFSLMEYIEQTGRTLENICKSANTLSKASSDLLHFVFDVLPTCYYTQNPDYISAHIVGTAISQSENSFNYLDEGGVNQSAFSSPGEQPFVYTSSTDQGINQSSLDILKKLYQYTNIATAIGGKIAEFMRAIFGSDYKDDHQSNFIGSNTMELNITDVMSTAEVPDGAFLGEYAGQGKGADAGQNLHFTCPSAGYLISAFCVVPDARFCQGVDPNGFHKSKFDYYTPQFDSLTLLPSRKSIVFATNDINKWLRYDGGFGNIPNYMEYKQSFDRLNGDLSMRSTRGGLLPFSMQKLISFGSTFRNVDTQGKQNYTIMSPGPDLFVAGEIWRYIGRDRWLGNFDRIFVESGNTDTFPGISFDLADDNIYTSRLDDQFVCYFYNDVEVTGYELPVADSFQTDSFGDTLKVEKA